MSSLVICPILGHLAKTLTADDKYYFPSRENLPQQIHMQLSQKQIIFPESFPPFLKSISIFENFEKKITLIPYLFPEIQNVKDLVTPMTKKPRFRKPFDSQHAKGSQTLVKSA